MGGVRAGKPRIHKAQKVDSHLQVGFEKSQTYTVHAGYKFRSPGFVWGT